METAVVVSRILIWVLAIMLGLKLIKGIALRLIGIGYIQAMLIRDLDEDTSNLLMDDLCKTVSGMQWIYERYLEKTPDYVKRIRAKTAVFNEEEDS